jgi:uncharacterized repeat protein (TIGR03803 family)
MQPANSSCRRDTYAVAFSASVFLLSLLLSASGSGQTVTTLRNFNGTNGSSPFLGALTQGHDGKLYGTTYSGGVNGIGAVYRFNQSTNFIQVLHSFATTDGSSPAAGLTLATDGNYYGTTNYGGSAGKGVLFKITSGGGFTVLHSFLGGSDGGFPDTAPIQASDGNLYGVSVGGSGGDTTSSTVYKFTRAGIYSIVFTFDSTTGTSVTGLLQGSDGNLYATADTGGANGCGSIVKLTLSGVLKQVHSFSCQKNGGGSYPFAALIQGADGNYYGTTTGGGTGTYGVLFRLGSGFGETVLHDFSSTGARDPQAGLMQATDGNLYGVSINSGNLNGSILYSFNPSTSAYSELYLFSGVGFFSAPLMQHTSGLLYGPSWTGGTQGDGFLYSVGMGLGPFVAFVHAQGKVGSMAQILGQGLTGTTGVTFNGVAATSFAVMSDTFMTAVVPAGATTGPVVVTTPGGTLTSNVNFRVSP